MHHYTYLLKCIDTKELYIGKRSCKITPNRDSYWSSSKVVKAMMRDGKRFLKRVLQEHSTAKEALEHEIALHNKYDVGRSPRFLNLSKQTSSGFDVTGVPMSQARIDQIVARNKTRVYTQETCDKISKNNKGKIPWNKGKKASEMARKRLSLSCKGRVPWNKGKAMSEDQKEKLRNVKRTPEQRQHQSQVMRGRTPWNKKNKTTLASEER